MGKDDYEAQMWYLASVKSGKSSYQLRDVSNDPIVRAVDGASIVFNSNKRKEAFEIVDANGSSSDKALARLSAGGGVLFTGVGVGAAGAGIIIVVGPYVSGASAWAASTPVGSYFLFNSDKILNRVNTGTGAIQTVQDASEGNWLGALTSAAETVESFFTGKMMNPRTANNAPENFDDFTSIGNFNIPKNKQQIDFIKIMNMDSDGTEIGGGKSGNIVYRAINKMDRWRLDGGLGLEAKVPNGPWGLDEHITMGSSDIAWSKDPWISTTEDIQIAKKFYKKEQLGIIEIDLDKVPNLKVKGSEAYPYDGPFSAHGLSKTQKEITILNEIPLDAIRELTPEEIIGRFLNNER